MVYHTARGLAVISMVRCEPVLLIDQQFDAVQAQPFAAGTVYYYTRRDPEKQTPNEDAIGLLPVGDAAGVLLIADGCGGQANGQLASQLAVEALAEALRQCDQTTNLRTPILDGFDSAVLRVRQLGTGAATTLLAVEINAGVIRTFHVGDSQALLVGSHGKVKLQTQAHSPVGYAVEAGMLTEKAALHHADRHLVSNIVGADDLHIDMGLPRRLAPQDTLLLGSDGLFDNLRLEEIVNIIRKGSLANAADRLCSLVQQRMTAAQEGTHPSKPDDLAFILFRLNPAPRNADLPATR